MKKTAFDTVSAFIGAVMGFLLGETDGLLYGLIAFILLDYITGILIAVITKSLSSEIGFTGILKKVLMFVLVALGNIIDTQIIGSGSVFRTAVIFVLIGNEGISILENSAALGIPVPERLLSILSQFKNENEGEDDE